MSNCKTKISLLLVGLMLSCMNAVCAAINPTEYIKILNSYGAALYHWSHNKNNFTYSEDIFKSVQRKAIVDSEFSNHLQREYPIAGIKESISLPISSFLLKIESWFENHEESYLRLVDPQVVREEDMEYAASHHKKGKENYVVMTGKIQVVSADNVVQQEYYEQYYINTARKKIQKISTYEVVEVNGQRKIRVDFSKLKEESTVGVSINYSKNWPVSLSASYSIGYFMIALDGGLNLDDDVITQKKLEMTDILNYKKEYITYNPVFYLTVTPSIYLKYFSVGCGIGIMDLCKKVWSENKSSTDPCVKRLMVRPTIKGYIPMNDEWFFTVKASYDYVPAVNLKNGLSIGLGLQYRLY